MRTFISRRCFHDNRKLVNPLLLVVRYCKLEPKFERRQLVCQNLHDLVRIIRELVLGELQHLIFRPMDWYREDPTPTHRSWHQIAQTEDSLCPPSYPRVPRPEFDGFRKTVETVCTQFVGEGERLGLSPSPRERDLFPPPPPPTDVWARPEAPPTFGRRYLPTASLPFCLPPPVLSSVSSFLLSLLSLLPSFLFFRFKGGENGLRKLMWEGNAGCRPILCARDWPGG